MLKKMWRALPWSHAALSTVHQRPYPKTGMAPLAPNTNRLRSLGARNERPCMPIPWKSAARLAR
jgi:hypothetical protein